MLIGVRRLGRFDEYFVKFNVRKSRRTIQNQFSISGYPILSIYSTTKTDFLMQGQHYPPAKKPLSVSSLELMHGKIDLEAFMRQQPTRLPYLAQYEYAVNRLRPPIVQRTSQKKRGIFIWGLADAGKTTVALGILGGLAYYDKDPLTTTYDGYQGQRYCLIDDVVPKCGALATIRTALNIKTSVQNVKHAITHVFFDLLIMTSNYTLRQLYPLDADYDMACVRFHQIEVIRGQQTDLSQLKAIMPA